MSKINFNINRDKDKIKKAIKFKRRIVESQNANLNNIASAESVQDTSSKDTSAKTDKQNAKLDYITKEKGSVIIRLG